MASSAINKSPWFALLTSLYHLSLSLIILFKLSIQPSLSVTVPEWSACGGVWQEQANLYLQPNIIPLHFSQHFFSPSFTICLTPLKKERCCGGSSFPSPSR